MQVMDVFNMVPKGSVFHSHAIGYISKWKKVVPAELSNWNDANRVLYLGGENYYSEEMTREQSCIRMLQGLFLGESLVVFDGDGSLYKLYRKYLSIIPIDEYIDKRINLSNPADSNGWNVLKAACTPVDKMINSLPMDSESAVSCFVKTVMEYAGLVDSAICTFEYEREWMEAIINYVLVEDKGKTVSLSELVRLLRSPAADIKEKLQQKGVFPKNRKFNLLPEEVLETAQGNILYCLSVLSDSDLLERLSKEDLDFSLPFRERCIYFVTIPEEKSLFLDLFCQELIKAGRMYLTDHVEPDGKELGESFPIPVHLLFNCPMPKHLFSVMERYITEFLPYAVNLSISFFFRSIREIPWYATQCFRTIVLMNIDDQETGEYASGKLYNNGQNDGIRYMSPIEIRKSLFDYNIVVIRGKGCFFVKPISLDEIFAENRG